MTLEDSWQDAKERWNVREEPQMPERMPSMSEWAAMFLITLVYWMLYHEYGPEACGEVGTEPRDTWDAGGSFFDGWRAMWGL